jgi:hypothetical protein
MSWYEMHRCVYDFVRSGEGDEGQRRAFDIDRYDLTGPERAAVQGQDIRALYELGLHSVLLNRYCRAVGYSRDDYRAILQPLAVEPTKAGRWQS